MQPDDLRAALDGAQPAVDAAWAKVARAEVALLAAKATGDDARYAAAWGAWQAASAEYEAAAGRVTSLVASLVPLVAWKERKDAA